jgi:hypothetical protein
MASTRRPGTLRKWLSRGFMFVIAFGVFLMFLGVQTGERYASMGGWLTTGIGIAWGIVKLWISVSSELKSPIRSTTGAFQQLVTHGFLFFFLTSIILIFVAGPLANWVAPSFTRSTEHVEFELFGYSILMLVISVILAIPAVLFLIGPFWQQYVAPNTRLKRWREG